MQQFSFRLSLSSTNDSCVTISTKKKKSALDIALDRKRMESHLNEPTADPIALSLEYLQLCTDNFHSEVLGEGAFGKVYLGVDKDLGIRMAVKRINLQIPDQNALDAITLSFKREIAVSENQI